ncbi:CofD-related protein, GAK system [Maridesulfovibrio ferrireducens]|uniref:CofD-related protein, GAK system n=1 Tax=Maridesulfovibrio ferrireducens TaxID=246191 RepID=A0A1G9J2G4_9BACT|nr:GAK system CofD-like protein [Maridesulfovibrio ferrireducens]SDL31502.1 CofD-related protein, GAK system [Maridesulfovibrio ferrireducens]
MGKDHPGIVFFSGGTALAGLSGRLAEVNPECSYIITTFDSGGSSAQLRKVFDMPAVGDIRNRLISLADTRSPEKAEIVKLLATRFPKYGDKAALTGELQHLANGTHPLMENLSDVVRKILSDLFALFIKLAGDEFDPANACLGNIILAAGFMVHKRVLAPPIAQFSRLIRARGIVRAASLDSGHLAVRLQNGEIIAGQHLFTGKEVPPVPSPIDGMWACSGVNDPWPHSIHASSLAMMLIKEADLIVYPMGSFYSSILASLTPKGMGQAVSRNPCPKIFIPNLGYDPELLGHDVPLQIEKLLEVLRMDSPAEIKKESVLNTVLIDSVNGYYQDGLNLEALKKVDVKIIDRKLVSDKSDGLIDPDLLAPILMEFARQEEF